MNKGFVVWLTGLPGAGKSTISHLLEKKLKEWERSVELLDDDRVRTNLCQGMGPGKQENDVSVQRIAFVCKLLARNGVAVISATDSPFRNARETARKEINNFLEVYVKCPPEVCAEREVQGLHKKALKANTKAVSGVSDPFEEPLDPGLVVETDKETVEASVEKVAQKLVELGYVNPKGSAGHVYSPEEEDKIKERLSRLGYI